MSRPHKLIIGAATLAVVTFSLGSLTASTGQAVVPAQDPALAAAETTEQTITASSVDTCTLITEAEAADTLGSEVSAVPNPSQCTYVAMDGTARALSIALPDFTGNRNDFEAGVAQATSAFEGTHAAIPAGDEAYAIVSEMVSEGLARDGDTYVVVVMTQARGTVQEQADVLNGLLETAFSRL